MGAWTVHIEGHGPHDNNQEYDIEELVKNWITEAIRNGHILSKASITIGTTRAAVIENSNLVTYGPASTFDKNRIDWIFD